MGLWIGHRREVENRHRGTGDTVKEYKNNTFFLNLLKPSGFFTYHKMYNSNFYIALDLRRVFCTDIRTDSDFCFIQH